MTVANGREEHRGLVRLILLFPTALEELVTGALMASSAVPEFTLIHVEGHTRDFTGASIQEKVRGCLGRRVIWLLIAAERLDEVLAHLRPRITSRDVRWWIEPVLASGTLL